MATRRNGILAGTFACLLLLAACGTDGETVATVSPDTATSRLVVVATTTILGDVVSNIVGADAELVVLIPVGADPHDYRASAAQVTLMHHADLVVANGLQLEEGIIDVLEAAEADGANLIEVGDLLDPLPFAGRGDGDEGEAHSGRDPHFWLDPLRGAKAGHLIARELAALDPSIDWEGRAEAYASELDELHAEIDAILAPIHAEDRRLITNHDSLGYFAARFGFEIVDTVIPGGATLADPSSAELAALVDRLREESVRAIFAETIESAVLAEALAAEAGSDVAVVELYTGSLGEPGSGADTLIGMLRINAQRIAETLT